MTYEEFIQEGKDLLSLCQKVNSLETNYKVLPITTYAIVEPKVEFFNTLSDWLHASGMRRIIRTKSGGISTDKSKGAYFPAYDIRSKYNGIEITIVSKIYGSMRIQWRNISKELFTDDGKVQISGSEAFKRFKTICKRHKIDLNNYIEKDKEKAKMNKESIEKPYIRFYNENVEKKYKDKAISDCHHLDYHSSYMTGLVRKYPEFKEVVEEIYAKRKTNNLYYKAILNMTQGYMQSTLCGLKWAHLSKAMIEDNNRRLDYLTECLLKNGDEIILYNTDGIWYKGPIYHGEDEGSGIGTWQNDHTDCLLRIKSKGCYEFVENGKYTPVVRGLTTLDKVKEREEWEWGDIYKAAVIEFKYDKDTEKLYFDGKILGGRKYENHME